ncbi:MAG: SDR family oxidoreductase [Burkholderiales bacterium]|nr:SDR family oxidoreductase [Burkholderiales bacterium]
MNQLDLNGRTAVITGGASGIGEATVRRMLDSGANVVIWDVQTEKFEKFEKEAHCIRVDMSNEETVYQALDETLKRQPKIDILVNSAGINGVNEPLKDYPTDVWRQVIDVNLVGVFLACRAVVPHMLNNSYGRIVNLSSVAGKEGNPTASAYSAAKAGVIALTRSLGKELATTGVLVNAVTPTTVDTPILEQVSQSHIDYMKSKIPMGRLGTAEELASLIAWLCTEDCSFSTAAVFDASGGRTTY